MDALPLAAGPTPRFLLVRAESLADAVARLDLLRRPWEPALTVDEKNRGRYHLLRLVHAKDPEK